MKNWSSWLWSLYSTSFRAAHAPVIIAALVIVAAWQFAEHQNRRDFEQDLRADVLAHLSIVRAKLEGNINGNLQLVRGLIATLETEPDMTQERFAELSANLLKEASQIRSIAGAPDLVVKLIYPPVGNERAIGLDYVRNADQRASALRARDTGQLILAGPLELVQGGQALIGRFPVFVLGDHGREFWGIVSAVVDLDKLYVDSGLLDPALPIDVALSGRDGSGSEGTRFFGSAAVAADDPVVAEVILPTGSWQIAARPRGGWQIEASNVWLLRLIIWGGGALILAPVLVSSRLIGERQRNIRALKSRERELERLSQRLGLALDTSQVAVWEATVGAETEFWDPRMNEMYGFPVDGKPRTLQDWEGRLHPDDREQANADFLRIFAEGSYTSQYRIVLNDGRIKHIKAIGTLHDDGNKPARIVGVNWDVTTDVLLNEELRRAKALTEARNTELEKAKASIEHNALHDSLTGLPNRRYLDELLAEHASRFADSDERAAVLQIDLDRFKQINDTLGHIAGDSMLRHAAYILTCTVEPGDFVARIGGDEFVVVRLAPASDQRIANLALSQLAERIIESVQQPMEFEGHECRVGVSIGISCDDDALADPQRLLVHADIALYRAKDRGRNRYQFFNEALQAEIITTKRVADDILLGLEQNQFVAYYQPQFDAETHEVTGVEALARWNHPVEGVLPPSAFLKIAEELNVVATIDRMILEQALVDFHQWEAIGLGVPKVAVNVSARRLHDDELIRDLRRMGIRPGTIAFELVESIFLDDNDELITWNVDQLKELGIDIEIDDFGTGYASIVSLMKLKPHRLKIDRQFVMPIVRSKAQRQLVGSIVDIGKSLGIEVLAEGVETMQHADLLRRLGCNALQGYAFARPMRAGDLVEFIQSRRWRKAS